VKKTAIKPSFFVAIFANRGGVCSKTLKNSNDKSSAIGDIVCAHNDGRAKTKLPQLGDSTL